MTVNSYKLALIGKNIAHSKSKKIYEKILGKEKVEYGLIDCPDETSLPSLDSLFAHFSGVSITAPYKKAYIKLVDQLDASVTASNCMNHISFNGKSYKGSNTDYFATKYLFDKDFRPYLSKEIFLLGNGSMAEMISKILDEKKIEYKQFWRKKDGNLNNLKLFKRTENAFIINTCSREFRIEFDETDQFYLWDLNYTMEYSLPRGVKYFDGTRMLYLQAVFALQAWGIVEQVDQLVSE